MTLPEAEAELRRIEEAAKAFLEKKKETGYSTRHDGVIDHFKAGAKAEASHWIEKMEEKDKLIAELYRQAKRDFDRINALEDRLVELGEA